MDQTKIKCLHPASNDKGMALITALIILIILSALGIFAANSSIVEGWRSYNYRYLKQAFYAADAGIEDGISRLVRGVVSDTGSTTSTTWNTGNTYTSANFTSPANPYNSFTIVHRLVGNPGAMPSSGSTQYLIASTGTSGTAKANIEAVITLNSTSNSPFTGAMTGCDGVTFSSNGSTNSYSFSGQPTNGNNGNVTTTVANANITFSSNSNIHGAVHATGNITLASNTDLYAQNVLADGNITMSGNAIIYDSAFSGGNISLSNNSLVSGNATASGTISLSGNAHIAGIQSPNSPPASPFVPTPTCDPLNVTTLFPTEKTLISGSNNNSGLSSSYYTAGTKAYSIGGNSTSTLGMAGQNTNYYFSSFTMNSNAVITVSGNVTMYINQGNFALNSNSQIIFANTSTKLTIYEDTGSFILNSNTYINNAGDPQNLQIYSNAQNNTIPPANSSAYMVALNSNSGLNGVVYAQTPLLTCLPIPTSMDQ